MTNETTENTTNKTTDNKALFGPLGKYAIVAVIMVSIIVTTAIMLDKELNTVEAKIAVIENEVSEMNAVASNTTAADIDNAVKTAAVADTEVIAIDEVTTNDQQEKEVSEVTQKTNEQLAETASTPTDETATEISTAEVTTPAETNRTQRNLEQQARAEANKLEQKQRMSEMFARINKLEAQQLEQFKASQDKNIVRLRENNTQQQHVIEALVLRNNELLEMRKTNLQKHQAKREQQLNRI